MILPCTRWSLGLFRTVCSHLCQDRGCLCSYSTRPSQSTSSWSCNRDPSCSRPPWATSTLSYSTWSSCKTHKTNTINKLHTMHGLSVTLEKGIKCSFFHFDQQERGECNLSEIPLIAETSLYRTNAVNAQLKGSVVFSHHSQQLFLCLSSVQDISDQQKWEQRASRPFFRFVEWRSQRTPPTATIEFIGKQLPEQKKQHNAEWREERTKSADSNGERRLWEPREWKLKHNIPPQHVIPTSGFKTGSWN